jgi:hypothetical protein
MQSCRIRKSEKLNCIDGKGDKCLISISKYFDPVDTGKITIMYPKISLLYMIYWI